MLSVVYPEIPLIDCEEHGPIITSKIIKATRTKKGTYFIQTAHLDSGITNMRRAIIKEPITYKVFKKIVDGKSTSIIISM